MTDQATEASQRTAGRVAGFTLLLLISSGLIGMFVFQNNLQIAGDAAATAHNILAHERSFRAGIVCEIVMFNCDVVLALALYALLKPINGPLALLGSFWRVANATVLGAGAAATLVALHVIGGAHSLNVFQTGQLQALSTIWLDFHDSASSLGLIFFCLGAAVHSYLLLKSRYIPWILSALYFFVAVQMLLCGLAIIVIPHLADTLGLWWVMPDFFVELSVALWLAFKGAKIPLQPA